MLRTNSRLFVNLFSTFVKIKFSVVLNKAPVVGKKQAGNLTEPRLFYIALFIFIEAYDFVDFFSYLLSRLGLGLRIPYGKNEFYL